MSKGMTSSDFLSMSSNQILTPQPQFPYTVVNFFFSKTYKAQKENDWSPLENTVSLLYFKKNFTCTHEHVCNSSIDYP